MCIANAVKPVVTKVAPPPVEPPPPSETLDQVGEPEALKKLRDTKKLGLAKLKIDRAGINALSNGSGLRL